MSMPINPESSSSSSREPTRELLLAQALDACIAAERRAPGSAAEIIARQPAWARDELRRLVELAGALDAAAASTVMPEDFRVAARERLMQRIGARPGVAAEGGAGAWLTPVPSKNGNVYRIVRRPAGWMWRGLGGGLLAAALVAAATLSASASALPGEPLYGIKQAREELGVRLAPDDEARALALLNQADARLDETARLLSEGRTAESAELAQRYDATVERATTAYVVAMEDTARDDATTMRMDSLLSQQQEQLQALLPTAPEPVRADLREALVATERGRALVSAPHSLEGRGSAARPAAAALPTPTVEPEPTPVPTATPVPPTPQPVVVAEEPTATAVVAEEPDRGEAQRGEDRGGEVQRGEDRGGEAQRGEDRPAVEAQPEVNRGPSRGGPPAAPARVQPAPARNQGPNQRGGDGDERKDEVLPAVPVIVEDLSPRGDGPAQVEGRRDEAVDGGGQGEERGGGQGDLRGGDQGDARGEGQGDLRGRGQQDDARGGGGGDGQARGGGGDVRGDDGRGGDVRGGDVRGGGDGDARGGGDTRGTSQPAQVADTRGQSGDGGQRSGDNPVTDTRGRSGDDGSQSAVARQPAPVSTPSSDNRSGRSGDDHPTPAPRAAPTPQPVVATQSGRTTSSDRNKEDGNKDGGGGGDVKPAAPTPAPPAPTATPVRRQPPTPTPARASGGGTSSSSNNTSNTSGSSNSKPAQNQSSGGDGGKGNDRGH